jgi:hypothetical protein
LGRNQKANPLADRYFMTEICKGQYMCRILYLENWRLLPVERCLKNRRVFATCFLILPVRAEEGQVEKALMGTVEGRVILRRQFSLFL